VKIFCAIGSIQMNDERIEHRLAAILAPILNSLPESLAR
jgi:hypothetical protein